MLSKIVWAVAFTFAAVVAPNTIYAQQYSPVGGGVYQNSEGDLFRKVVKSKRIDCGYGKYCVQQYNTWQPVVKEESTVNVYNVTPKTKNWRDHLAQYAGAVKVEQQNHADFMATIDALGLTAYNQYAGEYSQQAQQTQYGGMYAPQGHTNYQMRYSTLSDLVQRADPAVTMNQMSSHIKGMQELLRDATDGMQATVQMDVVSRNHAANTLANAAAAAQTTDSMVQLITALSANKGEDYTISQVRAMINNISQEINGEAQDNVIVAGNQSIRNSCVRCHSQDKAEGGLVLDGSAPLTVDQYRLSIRRVIDKSMPPPEAEPLTPEGIADVILGLEQSEITTPQPE